ncbi:MAG: sulfatase, partial [Candidatus Pacearchaeota archaeon]|nr:sulfatase [Candidatus Pacearchaeota archaeon]
MRRGAITAKTIGFFGVVLFLAVLGAWLNAKGLLLSPAEKPNLIFISLHDIRADHLGAYGYSRDTSPNIDAFSQDGILFENAFQQGARSSMSFASLFTSQYPRANGVVFVDQVLSSSATTLTEILGEEGYETGAFVQSSQLLAKYGITKDFGVLRQSGNSEDLLMFASSWLAENNDQPKFLFLEMSVESTFQPPVAFENHYDPEYAGLLSDHTEYYLSLAVRERPNAILPALKAINGQAVLQAEGGNIVLNERDLEHLVAHYDDGVRYADFVFGEMVEMLKKSGVYDNSVIVLFANHGETLTDHLPRDQMRNIQLTGFAQVYDEIIHSPLIVRGLGLKPGRVSSQVQLIDIFPTV